MPDIWRKASDCVFPGFASANTDHVFDRINEDLAVTDSPRLGGLGDGLDGPLDLVVADNQFDFHLGQEIDHIFRASIHFGVALLTTESARVDDDLFHGVNIARPRPAVKRGSKRAAVNLNGAPRRKSFR